MESQGTPRRKANKTALSNSAEGLAGTGSTSPRFYMEKQMADKTKWKCVGECSKEFEFGDWECHPGVPHEVEQKTYYLNDAPHCDFKRDPDGLAFKSSRNNVYVLPHKRVNDETGSRIVERPALLFIRGQYSTRNAEEQYFIERAKIDVGYDRWFDAYHTPTQKQNLKDNDLRQREARIVRLEQAKSTENELLESIKALTAKKALLEKETVKAGTK